MAHGVDASSTNAKYGLSHNQYYDSDASSSNTGTPTESDRAILLEEEQRERLLATESFGDHSESHSNTDVPKDGREPRGARRRQRKGQKPKMKRAKYQEGHLLYEMEDMEVRDDMGWPCSPSSLDQNMLKQQSNLKVCVPPKGSTTFAPTTILISLDGFRADFLQRNLTPTLHSFIAHGVSPRYMLPSFPSVTFPNHYTMVTGLYPESHGVVGNSFWDADIQEEFYYTDPARSMQPKWWSGGEPLWVTAEKQDLKTAIHMWPGSEAHIQLEPTFVDKFNGSEILSRKVDRILEFLDMPGAEEVGEGGERSRPQLIAAYVPVVDADGHTYGPNSTEIRETIARTDDMLHQLFMGINQRNLSDVVNIVVVSDHGMATTSVDRLIQLDDLIDLDLVEHIDGWPLYGLRPKDPKDLRPLYDRLKVESLTNTNFEVYLRDEDMPERYHFSKNERIAPLWVIPKTGWAIVHKEDFDVKKAKAKGSIYHPKGLHGYDHEHPLMRAIFVARGPAFRHQPNSRLRPFRKFFLQARRDCLIADCIDINFALENIEVYNIVCDSLGIEPKPNNGTLRLPLKTIGLHSDGPFPPENVPEDLPSEAEAAATVEVETETIELHKTPNISVSANGTSPIDNQDQDKADSMWGKWKHMMEEVKAAMAKLIAKLHGKTSTTGS
ncbi:MAG: hypothetical protein Q9191_005083 [Dirinaria sp. TL-2023a]